MTKPQYTLANVDDDESVTAPSVAYRDDPTLNMSSSLSKPYRDDPSTHEDGSVFDWGSDDTSNINARLKTISSPKKEEVAPENNEDIKHAEKMEVTNASSGNNHQVDDVSFAPLNLEDNDEEDLQHFSASRTNTHEYRLNVGGGWGRHGSNKCYLLSKICFCSRWAVLTLACIVMMVAFGILGYEAGRPSESTEDGKNHITKGEEWIDWMGHPKEHIHVHLPHLFHHNGAQNTESKVFQPKTQAQILQTSQLIFHSCNEHSISTENGRIACLSACHGRICCFEKETSYGSCINEPYSYCYVYAACENALADFGMSNTNVEVKGGPLDKGRLNEQDKNTLASACSDENIQTLEGIRDCNAFCMHHLCCFNGEGCGDIGNRAVCGDYESCKVLVKDAVTTSSLGSEVSNTFTGSMMRPTPANTANGHDFTLHDSDAIRTAVNEACNFDPLYNDESWVPGCHDLCADHLCCFGTPGTTSDCRQERNIMCSAYSRCNVLLYEEKEVDHEEVKEKYVAHRPEIQPGATEIPDDIRAVNEACNNNNVLKDAALRSRCEEACSSRKCCFMNGPGNCYILDTAWCDEFAVCQILTD